MDNYTPEDIENTDKLKDEKIKKLYDQIRMFIAIKLIKTDFVPAQILPNLYLGSIGAALSKNELIKLNITAILCLCDQKKNPFDGVFTYLTYNINDSPNQNILELLDPAVEFIDTEIKKPNGAVLVHCFAGKSRSTTFVLAYLIKKHAMTWEDALAHVRKTRPIAEPNVGFISQLKEYQKLKLNTQDQKQKE